MIAQSWIQLMILTFGNLCVTTSTCTRTLVDTYMPLSMTMNSYTWAERWFSISNYSYSTFAGTVWYPHIFTRCDGTCACTYVRYDIQCSCTLAESNGIASSLWTSRAFVPFRVVVELLYGGTYMYCTKFNASVLVRTLAEYRYGDAHMDGMKPSRFRTSYGPRCIYCTTHLGHKYPSQWFSDRWLLISCV